ncbi:MAG: alpha/beta fold hydrolase [Candidatus Andersenbacteria bacterium]
MTSTALLGSRSSEQPSRPCKEDLATRVSKLVIVGESSGGSVALRLAARYPDLVDGVVTVGGSLLFPQDWLVRKIAPLFRWINPAMRKVHRADVAIARRHAGGLHAPPHARLYPHARVQHRGAHRLSTGARAAALLQALHDHAVPIDANLICDSTSSTYKKVIWYPESYHVILIDLEKEQAFRDIVDLCGRLPDKRSAARFAPHEARLALGERFPVVATSRPAKIWRGL